MRRSDLDRAVEAGVIEADVRDRLLAFVAVPPPARPDTGADDSGPDSENFRLLTGFNDIFAALACALLLLAPIILAGGLVPEYDEQGQLVGYGRQIALGAGFLVSAGLAWLLAERFTRKLRRSLPSILLLVAFVGSSAAAAFAFAAATPAYQATIQSIEHTETLPDWAGGEKEVTFTRREEPQLPILFLIAGLAGVAAAFGHWRRFRVPITLAAGAAAVAVAVLVPLSLAKVPVWATLLAMLALGLAVFALAMHHDLSDLTRETRSTDIAFWLHLVAAPLIIHPLFILSGAFAPEPPIWAVPAVLLTFAVLTLVSLAIDRRAFLVAAVAYLLWAVQQTLQAGQVGVAASAGLSVAMIGLAFVALSLWWPGLRAGLLSRLPPTLVVRLPALA
jgi:hypothetical protein